MRDQPIIKPVETGGVLLIHVAVSTVLLAAFSIELFWFARAQDIWIDESTQLSGITLPLWDMLKWLTGQGLDRFGVPGDRTPPISYLFDWSWSRLVGRSELGLRLFHAAFVIGGVLLIATVAKREMRVAATIAVLLFLVLSPKLIQTAVEIRAYPIFFAITCVQVAIFLQLVPKASGDPRNSRIDLTILTVFAGLCLLAIYCHFYGIVSTFSFFLVLAMARLGSWRSQITLFIVFACLMAGSTGLVPFLTGAVGQSSPGAVPAPTAGSYLTYLLKLFGDSANMVILPAAFLFIGGTTALLISGTVPALVRILRRQATSVDWLALVVGVGATIPILSSFVITRFNTMSANYSGWLLAPLALLMGAGASLPVGFRLWDKTGRFVAMGATFFGGAISTFFFLTHAALFVHGPNRFVSEIFSGMEDPKAIVYEGAGWGYSYFPLSLTLGSGPHQYLTNGGRIELIRPGVEIGGGYAGLPQNIVSALTPYSQLLLVDIQLRTYHDLRECAGSKKACPHFMRSKIEEELIATGQWRESSAGRSFGLFDTFAKTFDRIPENCRISRCR
jgi:hypothetical protein